MKTIILFILFPFMLNAQHDIFIGQTNVLDLRGVASGIQARAIWENTQMTLGATYNPHNKSINPLICAGYYFVNDEYFKIGTNIQYDSYFSMPSINIANRLSNKVWFDFNIRPHTYTFIQADFTFMFKVY